MFVSARAFVALAAISFSGCQQLPSPVPVALPTGLAPSSRLIVGRVIAVDTARAFAFVELAADAPRSALVEGGELLSRTRDLMETGRLGVSRYIKGRTLGTTIVAGKPTTGDEVVWIAP